MELPQGQRLIHMFYEGGNEKLDYPPLPGLDLRGYRHPRTERDYPSAPETLPPQWLH